jgi:hypothetical protein
MSVLDEGYSRNALGAPNWISMFFIFQGFGMVMYIYIFEMFPGRYRESIAVFGGFWWTINVMTITVFGYGLRNYSWRYLQLATGLIGAICLGTYW